VGDIWVSYLKQFVQRYGGTKLERARDLFESALIDAPPEKVWGCAAGGGSVGSGLGGCRC